MGVDGGQPRHMLQFIQACSLMYGTFLMFIIREVQYKVAMGGDHH